MAKASISSSDDTHRACDSLAAVVSTDPLKSARVRSCLSMMKWLQLQPRIPFQPSHTRENCISHRFCSAPQELISLTLDSA